LEEMNLALVVVGRNTKNVVENNKKKAVNSVYSLWRVKCNT